MFDIGKCPDHLSFICSISLSTVKRSLPSSRSSIPKNTMTVVLTARTARTLCSAHSINNSRRLGRGATYIHTRRRHFHGNAKASNGASVYHGAPSYLKAEEPVALARLSTSSILRSLVLGAFFSSPILFKPGFAILRKMTISPAILNPDKNPLLRAIVKPTIYDHFCAGTTKSEVQKTFSNIRSLGFSGVILCYGKEIELEKSGKARLSSSRIATETFDEELEMWKQGNLETLDMIGHKDILALKYFSRIHSFRSR